ncbi:hypothetical protein [Streptomyces sp. NBC_00370]|uniref:hypothetical protein n=1 Tax=Streptomyces sp. NBC_00370 TaxID=2975728 RepID=UPI002E271B3D
MTTSDPRTARQPSTSATRRAGQLLCWAHAFAMTLTAVEAVTHPTAAWWPPVWPTAWALTAAALACWLTLRTIEKRRAHADGVTAAESSSATSAARRASSSDRPSN